MSGTKSGKSSSPRQTVFSRLPSRQAKEALRATCSELTNFLWSPCWGLLPPFHVFGLSSLALSGTAAEPGTPFHPWPMLPLPGSPLPPPPPPAKVKPCQRDPGGSSSHWRNKPFEQMCVIMKMGPAGKAEVFMAHLACGSGPRHPSFNLPSSAKSWAYAHQRTPC